MHRAGVRTNCNNLSLEHFRLSAAMAAERRDKWRACESTRRTCRQCNGRRGSNGKRADTRTLIFTDGAYWTKSSRAAYAFTAFHNAEWHDVSWWCPASSSYDSELAALEEAIQWAVVNRVQDPIFFVDNKAVVTSFFFFFFFFE